MNNSIIENIQRSLGHNAETLLSARPPVYAARNPGTIESEIQLFLEEVEKLSGVGQRLSTSDLNRALKALVTQQKIRIATVWGTPNLKQLSIAETLASLGVELVSPNANTEEMALCDLGITEADFILPETGTLVLRSSDEKPRGVSLLPPTHLAIVRPEMLRADMHQVFAEAKDSNYLVFITGPSRTADIELTTTLGVHGPKNLLVWMVEG
jgi:L-lactate dehydrogenase complex protein LldG